MKLLKKWTFMSFVVLLAFSTCILRTAYAYEYVESIDYDADWDYPVNNETSTLEEDAEADADATEYGSLVCYSTAYAYATDNDAAWIYQMSSSAWWTKSWEWSGPPGTAPGGTLDWEHDADGSAAANAQVDRDDGAYAYAACAAESDTDSSEGASAAGDADATAYSDTQNYADGYGSNSSTVDPGDKYPYNSKTYLNQPYGVDVIYGIVWDFYEDGSTPISSGTTYVSFSGSISCDCWANATAGYIGSGAYAWSDSTAHSGAGLEADFTSN